MALKINQTLEVSLCHNLLHSGVAFLPAFASTLFFRLNWSIFHRDLPFMELSSENIY